MSTVDPVTPVVSVDSESSGEDRRPRHRYPCPWCLRLEAWPDGCTESIDAPADTPPDGPDTHCCVSTIETKCMAGDHRRCRVAVCTVAARWHEPVREAAVTAANEAGHEWAIVSIINNGVEMFGTTDDLTQAKRVLRNVLSDAGYPVGVPEGKGLVYVVRASDGAFL